MSTVKELFDITPREWMLVIFVIVLLIFSVPTIVEQTNKMLGVLGLKSVRRIETDERSEQIAQLERSIDSIGEDIKTLNEGMSNLTSLVEEHIKQDNENNVAIIRNTLWRIHTESMENNYITKEGLKTFLELGKVYERSGGDDIYHDKLHPDIMRLDVR